MTVFTQILVFLQERVQRETDGRYLVHTALLPLIAQFLTSLLQALVRLVCIQLGKEPRHPLDQALPGILRAKQRKAGLIRHQQKQSHSYSVWKFFSVI